MKEHRISGFSDVAMFALSNPILLRGQDSRERIPQFKYWKNGKQRKVPALREPFEPWETDFVDARMLGSKPVGTELAHCLETDLGQEELAAMELLKQVETRLDDIYAGKNRAFPLQSLLEVYEKDIKEAFAAFLFFFQCTLCLLHLGLVILKIMYSSRQQG